VAGCYASLIRQGIGVDSRPPFRCHESRLAREVVGRLIGNAGVELVVDDRYDRDHHDRDDRERLEKQSMRELHDRSLRFRMR